MKSFLKTPTLAALACIGFASTAWCESQVTALPDETPKSAYEQVKSRPGLWNQMCGSLVFYMGGSRAGHEPDFALYSFNRMDAVNFISKENFYLLRENRAETIREIVAEFNKAIEDYQETGAIEIDFSFQLAILLDLNAVEALDTLLAWERHIRVIRAKEEAEAAQPPANDDGFDNGGASIGFTPGGLGGGGFGGGFGGGGMAHETRTFNGRHSPTAHAKVLTTIAAILREERYAPLLASPWERQFGEKLAKDHEEIQRLRESLKGFMIPDNTVIDWNHNLPRSGHSSITLTLDDTAIETITTWAKDYLATTPPEKRRGAAGMHKWPIGI